MALIPEDQYLEILKLIPIICVDLVIEHKDQVLLVKRGTYPAKRQWWLPGGRVLKGEQLETAALRKAQEETGLRCRIAKPLGFDETFFNDGQFIHSVNIIFHLVALGGGVYLDQYHTDFKWIDEIPTGLHSYVIRQLRKVL